MAEQHQAAGGAATYQDLLREQAQRLTLLRVQRGNPSLRAIEKRGKKLFEDEKVSLPIATQSTAFGGGYVGQDRLLWLVRTLLSWDEYGKECAPLAYGAPELDEWYELWRAITAARPRRRRAPAAALTGSELQEPTLESETPPVSPVREPASEERSVLSLRLPEAGSYAMAQFFKYGGPVHGVAFSPDGTVLATTGHDGTVRLRGPATHQLVGAPLTHPGGAVYAVAFSPDGTLLATTGHDGTVRLWTTLFRS